MIIIVALFLSAVINVLVRGESYRHMYRKAVPLIPLFPSTLPASSVLLALSPTLNYVIYRMVGLSLSLAVVSRIRILGCALHHITKSSQPLAVKDYFLRQ